MSHEWVKHSGTQMHCRRCSVIRQSLNAHGPIAHDMADRYEYLVSPVAKQWQAGEPPCPAIVRVTP